MEAAAIVQHHSVAIGHCITLQQSLLQEFRMTHNNILINLINP